MSKYLIFSIWGLSEELLQKGYLEESLKCLEGLLSQTVNFARYPELEFKTRLRIGIILIKYTNNYERAKYHLELAVIYKNKKEFKRSKT
jgi:hypothetical protein